MNFFDISVALILLVSIWMGYTKGLILSLFNLCSTFLSLLLTNMLYPAVSGYIREKGLFYDGIKQWVIEHWLDSAMNAEAAEITIQSKADILSSFQLPENFLQSFLSQNPDFKNLIDALDIKDYIGGFVSDAIINAISMTVVFLLLMLIFRIVAIILDTFSKLPVLSFFNKLGGAAIGLVFGLTIIWIVFSIIPLIFTRVGNEDMYAALYSSVIAIYFYENNLLLLMVGQIFL